MTRTMMLAAAAAVALGGCTPKAPSPPAAGVKMYTLDCGKFEIGDADGFADDGSMKGVKRALVNPCFLIRHPSGDLLWDTGLPDALADLPQGLTEGATTVTLAKKLAAQLTELGLTPADIEFVSFSHMHGDHTGNGNLFASSVWIVDKQERDAMFSEKARADKRTFDAYAALGEARTAVIETEEPHDVFGDGSVVIHAAPGHTPGHSVLLVKLAQSGPVLLAGDLWHLAESQEKRLVPRFNYNRDMTLQSMDKVEALARDNNARIIHQHVPEDIAALPKPPAAME